MKQEPNKTLNHKTIILINVILAQTLVVVINGTYGVYESNLPINIPRYYITTFSLLAGVVLAITAIFQTREILRLSKKEVEAEFTLLNLKKNEELLNVLRVQRHDFMNHIQVICGLAQLQKTSQMMSYISTLTDDMYTDSKLSGLTQIEFAACLIKKKSLATEQGIKFDIYIFSNLEKLRIPATKLVRVVGNLIDNAFFAVKEQSISNGQVLLKISEENSHYNFLIANTGSEIPAENTQRIFERGFTTKGKNGSGLGLFIVKQLVEFYGGSISLVDEPGFSVCFRVQLPMLIED